MTEPPQQAPHRRRNPLQFAYRITRISWRDLFVVVLPALALVALVFAISIRYIRPAPPSRITMASGPDGSSFRNNAEKYRKALAKSGITVDIRPTQGSVENLQLLADPSSGVDIGFVQGGLPAELHKDDVDSLGSMFFSPLIIMYWSPTPIERLSQLAGKRVSLGRNGSGGHALALSLLKANGIEPGGKTQLLGLDGDDALSDMLAHKVDAVFLSADSAAPDVIRRLLHTKGIRIFDFGLQAEAYVRRMQFLSKLEIPEGAFDLGANVPDRPLTMVAPTVELVARPDLHPALSDLLIEAAQDIHGHATLLQKAGAFPSPVERDFPISEDASRYYKSGKSFAYKHLPFWLASLADRVIVILVPTLVVLVPALRVIPGLYRWRIRARIFRRYAQLIAVERESLHVHDPEDARDMLRRVDAIELAVINLKLPSSFSGEVYVLRQHIDFVRNRLTRAAEGTADGEKEAHDTLPAVDAPPQALEPETTAA